MKNPPPEVLIYVQKMKLFFENDVDANKYFLSDIEKSVFYKNLTDIASENFINKGDPELNVGQFELLRKTVRAICVIAQPIKQENFIDYGIYGKIYLN